MKKTLIALAFALAALPFAGDAAAKGFADYHTETLKLPCTTCHATKDEMPTTDTCIKCHPKDKLVASTKNVKPTNPHTSPHYNADLDCFIFDVYGYGHGCGMSQWGAIGYARNGWGYQDILTHYFVGTTITTY